MRVLPTLLRGMAVTAAMLAALSVVACSGGTENPSDVTDDTVGDVNVPDTNDATTAEDHVTGETRDDVGSDDILTDVDNPEALELVAQGKELLSAGESLSAMNAFKTALGMQHGLRDAQFGMVLARFQSTVAMLGSLTGLLNFKDDPDAVPVTAWRSFTWTDHEGTIGSTIDAMWYAAYDQQERIEAIKADPDATFDLPGGLPLSFKDDLMMNLCCEWDISDIYGISSFNNLMLAFVSFMGSQDTDVNLSELEQTFKNAPGMSNALVQTLEDYPDALKLIPGSGADSWKAAKGYLLASTEDALESARLMGEGNDRENNVATLTADANPYLELHGTFPNGAQSMEFLWDGKAVSLKAVVERAKAHLSGTPDSRLSLDADALVALSVLVDIINRTVGIETVVSGLGIELPDIAISLLGSLDKNDPEQLASMLPSMTSLLGIESGTVYLDIAAFLDSPFNLRDMFPNWGPDPGTEYKTFLRSFECVRAGTTLTDGDGGSTLTFWVHNPLQTTAPELTVTTSPSYPATAVVTDSETINLEPYPGFTGLFRGALTLVTADTATANDGTLNLPLTGGLIATYIAPDEAGAVEISGNWTEGFTPWDYGAACIDDQVLLDLPHFGETEFATAVEITTPGQTTALQSIAADGEKTATGFMAFKSPSFDHLLWLKIDDTVAEANQTTFAGVFTGVLKALEGF